MTEDEALFLRKLQDLRERSQSSDPYMVLGTAALLRHLLLDGTPLVTLANRRHGVKFRFEVNDSPPAIDQHTLMWSLGDGLDPDVVGDRGNRTPVKRDRLLALPIIVLQGQKYSVHQVIDHVAIVDGAVHREEPSDDSGRLLAAWSKGLNIFGMSMTVQAMRGIAMVVSKGLEPVADAIRKAPA